MTTMYDSTNPDDIPLDAEAVAGYVNGRTSAWPTDAWDRFTSATVKRHISVTGEENVGDTLDIEFLDANIDQAAGWVVKRVDSGLAEADLWLYVDRANFDALKSRTGDFTGGYWVADWTGEEHDVEGAVATQYANPSTSGGHYDLSHIPAPAPAPGPEPEPQPTEDPEMAIYCTDTQGTGFVVATDLTSKRGLPDPEDAASLQATGLYREAKLTDAFLAQIPDAPNAPAAPPPA